VLPRQYRARANGVMQSGPQIVQGGAVMIAGVLAGHLPPVPAPDTGDYHLPDIFAPTPSLGWTVVTGKGRAEGHE
jgi:hypothetical protein